MSRGLTSRYERSINDSVLYQGIFQSLLVLSGIILLIFLYLWGTYNAFVGGRNRVKNAFADIDVQLKRRASLIDNLVTLVREYAKHEKTTLENVTKARSALQKPHGPKQLSQVENVLTSTLKSLFAVAEAYPKLLASENYKRLMEEIEETENLVSERRETYNKTTLNYNTMLQIFPNLLVTGLFSFQEEEFFDVPDETGTEVNLKNNVDTEHVA